MREAPAQKEKQYNNKLSHQSLSSSINRRSGFNKCLRKNQLKRTTNMLRQVDGATRRIGPTFSMGLKKETCLPYSMSQMLLRNSPNLPKPIGSSLIDRGNDKNMNQILLRQADGATKLIDLISLMVLKKETFLPCSMNQKSSIKFSDPIKPTGRLSSEERDALNMKLT